MNIGRLMISRRAASAVLAIAGMMACATALAAPTGVAADEGKETLFSLIMKGGPVMIPLGLCSVIGAALAIERFISLKKERIIPVGFHEKLVEAMKTGGRDGALKYCEEVGGPAGSILKAGLQNLHKGEDAIEKAIEDVGYRESDKMKRSLRNLSNIASIAPLLGLLGTIYGMITAFQTASTAGVGKAGMLAKGIYEALVTTAAGLTIAIPVLLAYQYLANRVDSIIDDLDEIGVQFMTHYDETQRSGKGRKS